MRLRGKIMDWFNILTFGIPLVSLTASAANLVIDRFFKNKKSYLKMKTNDREIELSYNSNRAILLSEIEPFLKTKEIQEDLALEFINKYILKLSDALNDF